MEFKRWLQTEMDARGLDPSKLARISKVPQPTIFRILSGETKDPRTGTVKKLERALGSTSLPMEAPPNEHQELIDAWRYLLPGEQHDLMDRIKQLAGHNKDVLASMTPKQESGHRVVRVSERRKSQMPFGIPDRRLYEKKQ
jgi:hypothetical protein